MTRFVRKQGDIKYDEVVNIISFRIVELKNCNVYRNYETIRVVKCTKCLAGNLLHTNIPDLCTSMNTTC